MLGYTITGLGGENAKNALVADLAAIPTISTKYAQQLVDDLELWSLEHARFIAADVTPGLANSAARQIQSAVRSAVAPVLMIAVVVTLIATAVTVATLISTRSPARQRVAS
jgi:hypothetical protein